MSLTRELQDKNSFARMFVDREFLHLPVLSRTVSC
jgi:hypothetical protein